MIRAAAARAKTILACYPQEVNRFSIRRSLVQCVNAVNTALRCERRGGTQVGRVKGLDGIVAMAPAPRADFDPGFGRPVRAVASGADLAVVYRTSPRAAVCILLQQCVAVSPKHSESYWKRSSGM